MRLAGVRGGAANEEEATTRGTKRAEWESHVGRRRKQAKSPS